MNEHITFAGNVEVPAYLALQAYGFAVERAQEESENASEYWVARKGDLTLSATNPLEILGIMAMRDKRGKEWKASDKEIDSYLRKYYSEAGEDE
ncbi:MAG: hypothetical protein AAF591_18475 [Verrucomicrobiota bacterium]